MTKTLTPDNFRLGLDFIFNAERKFQPFQKFLNDISFEKRSFDFWSIASVIIGQQLSGLASAKIESRVLEIDRDIKIPKIFKAVNFESLRACGMSNQKANFLFGVANMLDKDPDYFDRLKDLNAELMQKQLQKIKGVGPWSASILTLFYAGKSDVMIKSDVTINKVIQYLYNIEIDEKSNMLEKLLAHWRPYRSVGCIVCYQLFDRKLLPI